MILTYACSHNTIRRAVSALVTDGYVQTMQGNGVRNIFQPAMQTSFTIDGIESFRESAMRNHQIPKSEALCFTEIISDKKTSNRTGFPVGAELYYLQRLHYHDGILFEYTQSRHRPDHFCFQDNATRHGI